MSIAGDHFENLRDSSIGSGGEPARWPGATLREGRGIVRSNGSLLALLASVVAIGLGFWLASALDRDSRALSSYVLVLLFYVEPLARAVWSIRRLDAAGRRRVLLRRVVPLAIWPAPLALGALLVPSLPAEWFLPALGLALLLSIGLYVSGRRRGDWETVG